VSDVAAAFEALLAKGNEGGEREGGAEDDAMAVAPRSLPGGGGGGGVGALVADLDALLLSDSDSSPDCDHGGGMADGAGGQSPPTETQATIPSPPRLTGRSAQALSYLSDFQPQHRHFQPAGRVG
jgi:hypothetical protein